MNKRLLERAKKLAARPYEVQYIPDVDSDGEPVVFARIPEMPGCVSHGHTIEEAMEWIELAKIDFIYFYLEDGLMPPEPAVCQGEETPQVSVLDISDESAESETVTFSNSQFSKSDLRQSIHKYHCIYA